MRANRCHAPRHRESGAVLLVAVVLLLLTGVLTLFALNVGLIEQRSTGNDLRAKVVGDVAEAGLAQGFEFLLRQHAGMLQSPALWERCQADDETFPCGAISAATFDHDGDVATAPVSRRGSMFRLKADDTHTIAGIDNALAKFMLPLPAASKIANVPNGWSVAYGVAPVLCFAERPENPGAGGIPCGSGTGAGATSVSIATFVSVARMPGESASQTLVQTV